MANPFDSIGVWGVVAGNTVAKIGEVKAGENAAIAVVRGETVRVVAGIEYLVATVQNAVKKTHSGYVKKSDIDNLESQAVSIPQSFVGLEAVMVPTRLEEQLFRVVNVEEDDDYVTITARHVWYDNLQNYTLWEPAENTNYSAGAACRNVLQNAISPCNSRVATDCTDELPGKELDYTRKNLVEAFLDPEKGICARYGLSLIRNNWDFYVLKEVGYNRGIVIQDKKNLLGVQRHENIENVATRVCPYAKDADGNVLWMNNDGVKWLDADNINDYAYPRVMLYDTGLQVGKDDVTAQNIQAKLLESAQKKYSEEHVNDPEVEFTIQFISLGDTEEYAQYRDLDKVYLYDIITIINTERGYQYTAQVVGVEHDALTGRLNSVTIGKLGNWDGKRKIATWQVPEISGENIRLKSILSGSFAPGAIFGDDIANGGVRWMHIDAASIDQLTTQQLSALNANIKTLIAGSITADDIEAGSITADRIDVEDLAAAFAEINVLEAAIATIAEASIASASIGFAQIVDANIQNLIAHDAVTDRYYINKLAVDNATFVHAVVGDLVVKATDNKYYKLVINADGSITPQEVTLTIGEINAGVTSDGKGSIIETDLTVTELSAGNMKAINALIDKLTASRIDVDLLFAREASISKIHSTTILGNKLLALTVTGGSEIYEQYTDPATNHVVKDGDRWKKTITQGSTWADFWNYTISQIEDYQLQYFGNSELYIRNDGAWEYWTDDADVMESTAELILTGDAIRQMVSDKYGHVSGIEIESLGVAITGNKYIKLDVDQNNFVHISGDGIDMKGCRVMINGTDGMWARDDIIIMSPNSPEVWRRTVAGIESQMNGKHDWVLIRPYYDAKIIWNLLATYTILASSVGGNVAQLQQESGLAASFGTSSTYQYIFKFTIPTQNFTELGLGLTLANNQELNSNAITASGTYQISAVTPTTLEITINSAVNLCAENAAIWFKLESVGRTVQGVSDISLTCKCNATVSRVPCTVYYYP